MRTLAFDAADGDVSLLSDGERRARLALFERTWSRGAALTVVKATSICTNLMQSVDEKSPLVFVYQQPDVQLAVLLAGENSEQDLRGFAQHRYRRMLLAGIDLKPLATFTVGELAALAWLAEVISAAPALTERSVKPVDFDQFLGHPDVQLQRVCRHLGLDTDQQQVRSAVNGPIMRKYSKAPEYDYAPALRYDVIADSRRRNASDITDGLRWLENVSASASIVEAAVTALSPPG